MTTWRLHSACRHDAHKYIWRLGVTGTFRAVTKLWDEVIAETIYEVFACCWGTIKQRVRFVDLVIWFCVDPLGWVGGGGGGWQQRTLPDPFAHIRNGIQQNAVLQIRN